MKNSKIYISGHTGLVGSALLRKAKSMRFSNVIYKTHQELDLSDEQQVSSFFEKERPDIVFLAAAKMGGLFAMYSEPADYLYQNLKIQMNVIHHSYLNNVKKLIFLGSTCIYPRDCKQPIKETSLMTGPLEKTNESYAITKIAGVQMCQSYYRQYGCEFISVMPSNLYGPCDNYDLENSHVMPALIRKFVDAKRNGSESVEVRGTGKPIREFTHSDDLADALFFLEDHYSDPDIINIGSQEEISIHDLAQLISEIVGFEGKIIYNTNYPDGTPHKCSDSSKLNALGWKSSISLKEGLRDVISAYSNSRT